MTTLQNHREMLVDRLIDLAIDEDVYTGDVTTDSIVPESTSAVATMTAKADGVISGLPVVEKVFRRFQEDIVFKPAVHDGDTVRKGDVILRVEGSYPALLKAERTALNFFQRMSGIATETARYVAELRGTHTRLLDTRKTAPGMRVTDKMAVHDGGAANHRMGLYDMAMIKDNHIKMAGSIAAAVEQVRSRVPSGMQIEVETTNLDEVKEALEARADIIMLDNMSTEMMRDAVNIIGGRAKTEASGNMTLQRIAEENADFVGELRFGAQPGRQMGQMLFQCTAGIAGLLQIGSHFPTAKDFFQRGRAVDINQERRGPGTGFQHGDAHASRPQLGPPGFDGGIHSPGVRLHPAKQVGGFEPGHDRSTLGDKCNTEISAHEKASLPEVSSY